MGSIRKYFRYILSLSIWAVFLGFGFWKLFIYSNTPGELASALHNWPTATKISRDLDTNTLLVFVHPHCPCSDASVGELERLMPHISGKVKSVVVFFKPKNKSEEWVKGKLWQKTKAIPGVEALLDEEGVEALHFDAKTSGQTFLYDKSGQLIFRGGLTPERGHMGDSDGRRTILSFVATGDTQVSSTPVFGCSIRSPERALAGGSDEKKQ